MAAVRADNSSRVAGRVTCRTWSIHMKGGPPFESPTTTLRLAPKERARSAIDRPCQPTSRMARTPLERIESASSKADFMDSGGGGNHQDRRPFPRHGSPSLGREHGVQSLEPESESHPSIVAIRAEDSGQPVVAPAAANLHRAVSRWGDDLENHLRVEADPRPKPRSSSMRSRSTAWSPSAGRARESSGRSRARGPRNREPGVRGLRPEAPSVRRANGPDRGRDRASRASRDRDPTYVGADG